MASLEGFKPSLRGHGLALSFIVFRGKEEEGLVKQLHEEWCREGRGLGAHTSTQSKTKRVSSFRE